MEKKQFLKTGQKNVCDAQKIKTVLEKIIFFFLYEFKDFAF